MLDVFFELDHIYAKMEKKLMEERAKKNKTLGRT